ncbi:winged helix-turn-helix transcriptional regulator [Mycolicibacterium smegmatis]|uniref:Transcriptional regulator n=2 Tax=Mycolicibacterium smegmatis TaxID=1772 RepID=A0QWD6_MYCS2|nr:helix-turn-helix domain-containing protein [Mycolicibacterium smegmatis]ABK72134.1 transcriptional regulator [Mycolicibacterium smegmatis MC2 155]MCC3338024.1 helix-turn-helix transcriptional regulator [Mycolicibacterium smegmatis]MCO4193063.1 helix-turn-helix transcriptional regulator [Mycolicibacterium smegmatis]MCP2624371.1 helix-turn-helix transcriptional regulator [Mycolicibacterium smegmatis]TBH21101.1 transcriptional regulator [Mycolicibacterium smegmatis MC2 155]
MTSDVTQRTFYCGLDAALAIVGGRWKFLIVWQLAVQGAQRYGQLRARVEGVSEKVLIGALRDLEADGVVERRDHRTVPPHVEYSLTPSGVELAKVLEPLCRWGYDHMKVHTEARTEQMAHRAELAALA